MTSEQRALPLIRQIYAAALEPMLWHDFVKSLSDEFGGAAVGLSLQVPGLGPPIGIYRCGFRDGFDAVFAKLIAKGMPWGELAELEPTPQFQRASEYLPDAELATTDFYREYMEPQGLACEGPLINLIHPREGLLFSGIAIYRKVEGPPFSDEDVATADLLVPHLAQAFGIHCRVGGIDRARLALGEVIDRVPSGVVLLDRKRRPVVCNRAAQKIAAENDGFHLDDRGPRAAMQPDDAALQSLIERALNAEPGSENHSGGFVSLTRPSGRRPLSAMVTPLLEPSRESTSSDAAAMLFISDSEAGSLSTVEMLRTLYGLTQAEAELVQLLVSGHTVDEVAEIRGVTMNTARSQLKHVFAKTDTRRQGELIRLIVTGVASLRGD